MGNTYGNKFRITTFGESHGKAIGVTIDGCPAGLEIEEEFSRLINKNVGGRDELFKMVARSFQAFAKCKNLDLLKEDINGKSAVLSYRSTDDCQEGKINIKKKVIYMK